MYCKVDVSKADLRGKILLILCRVLEHSDYRKGSGASLGSCVCGSEVSYGKIEIQDDEYGVDIEGVQESSDRIGSLSSTSDPENVLPPLVRGLLY